MALRKSRDGTWIVDVSNGINPISLKQRRIVRKGFKTKKEALEAEQYLRSVELKEKSFNSKISIDILYDRAFLQQQRKLADELGYEELTKEVIAFIDLTNLSTMARGIVQHQNSNFLSTVLSSAGSLSKKELLTYAEKSLVEFTAFVRTTNYGQLLEKIINKETNELNLLAFEKLKDDYLTSMYENGRTVAFGPLPLLAFLNAKEVEWKNLRLILVGKHSGFSNEKIRERMRKVNGV